MGVASFEPEMRYGGEFFFGRVKFEGGWNR